MEIEEIVKELLENPVFWERLLEQLLNADDKFLSEDLPPAFLVMKPEKGDKDSIR